MRIVPNPRYEVVDASVSEHEVMPLRSKLKADFDSLLGKPVPVTKAWLDKMKGVLND